MTDIKENEQSINALEPEAVQETSKLSKITDDKLLNPQHNQLTKYKTNIQNNVKQVNKIVLSSTKFLRTRTIQEKSKSTSNLIYYKIKDTLKQIIDKGVQFNLSEVISLGEKGTQYHRYRLYITRLYIALSIAIFTNIVLAIIENQVFISETIDYMKLFGLNDSIYNRPITITENALLVINLILSFTSGIILLAIYQMKFNLLRIDQLYSQQDSLIFSSTLIKPLLARLLIVLIFFPPGVNGIIIKQNETREYQIYSWNGIICTISLIKISIIFESLNALSIYTSTIAQTVCKKYKAQLDNKFVFKANMKHYPFLSLLLFGGFFIIILAFLIINFEFVTISNDEYNSIFQKWLNALWFISATMETIDFGDISPTTVMGHIISFMSGVIGYFLLTLLLIAISSYSEFTFDEMKAFYKLKTLLSDENHEKKAINIIKVTICLRLNIIRRNKATEKEEKLDKLMRIFALMCHLKLFIINFHNEYHISRSWSIPVDDYLINLENNFSKDLLALQRAMKSFSSIDSDVKIVESNQEAIDEDLNNISMMQSAIAHYIVQLNNENILYQFKDPSSKRRGIRGLSIESEMSINQTCSDKSIQEYIKEENNEEDKEYICLARPNRRSLFS